MNLLDINMVRTGNEVAMQIIHQDPNLTSEILSVNAYKNDDIIVRSAYCPEIRPGYLFIRGRGRIVPDAIYSFNFETEDLAIQYVKNVRIALKYINGSNFVVRYGTYA